MRLFLGDAAHRAAGPDRYVQPDSAKVCQMHWSKDGQLFTVGLDNGSIVTSRTGLCVRFSSIWSVFRAFQ